MLCDIRNVLITSSDVKKMAMPMDGDTAAPTTILPGFFVDSDPATATTVTSAADDPNASAPAAATTNLIDKGMSMLGAAANLMPSTNSSSALSNPHLLSGCLIALSFIMVCGLWALSYAFSKHDDPMKVWVAKDPLFITMQLVVMIILFGILIFIMVRKKQVNAFTILNIFICMSIYTFVIWACFLAKDKTELFLNYTYDTNDIYSRIQLLMLYTIISSVAAISFI
jgi:hypothetical protein